MERIYKQGEALAHEIAETTPPDGAVALWFLGQASIAVKGAGAVVYIDPYFSSSRSRAYPSPLTPEQLTQADWVLCTHNHLDHLDLATLRPIAAKFPACRFVVPAPHVEHVIAGGLPRERISGARVGQTIDQPPLRVSPVRAKHEEFEQRANGDFPYLGYLLELGGVRVFHSGDTVGFDGQAEELRPLRPDVAFLPINGRDWRRNRRQIAGNMNYREALDLAQEAGVDLVVPIHYDLFAGNTENPAYFVDHLYRTAPAQKFKLFAVGERIIYMR